MEPTKIGSSTTTLRVDLQTATASFVTSNMTQNLVSSNILSLVIIDMNITKEMPSLP